MRYQAIKGADSKTKTIYHCPPSKDALIALAALQSAVTKALVKKQKLGHYAVFWKNGEVTLKHFDKQSDEA